MVINTHNNDSNDDTEHNIHNDNNNDKHNNNKISNDNNEHNNDDNIQIGPAARLGPAPATYSSSCYHYYYL